MNIDIILRWSLDYQAISIIIWYPSHNHISTDFRDDDNIRNLEFEPLPEFLTEIPLDDVDSFRSQTVITTEPWTRSQLEVTTVPNDVMFPEDMFER